jgi:hypothetical protein
LKSLEDLLRSPRVSYEPLRQPASLPFDAHRPDDDDERFGRRLLELRLSVIQQQARDESYQVMLNSQLQASIS